MIELKNQNGFHTSVYIDGKPIRQQTLNPSMPSVGSEVIIVEVMLLDIEENEYYNSLPYQVKPRYIVQEFIPGFQKEVSHLYLDPAKLKHRSTPLFLWHWLLATLYKVNQFFAFYKYRIQQSKLFKRKHKEHTEQ